MMPHYRLPPLVVQSHFALLAVALMLIFPSTLRAEKLQIYILAGQSNMQGHAEIRTFPHIAMEPATAPMFDRMTTAEGRPRICERVWISVLGCGRDEHEVRSGKLTAGFGASPQKIGPEFTFGLYTEANTTARVLIIKTAWGGKSLHTDFRPPSAGPYPFHPAQLAKLRDQGRDLDQIKSEKSAATGHYYRQMIEHVRNTLGGISDVIPDYDPSQGYELAGFAWVQGWNDMVDGDTYPQREVKGGYDAYTSTLAHFIRDVRRDLDSPTLPFVIGVLGVGGPTAKYGPEEKRYKGVHQNFRDAMAAPALLPEFRGNVAAVLMEDYWDKELSDAKAKEQALRQEARHRTTAGGSAGKSEMEIYQSLRIEKMTPREREIAEIGVSNFEFHYLGSAKILGGVGKGLADAMAQLISAQQ